jgi:hypothetical protein
MNAVVLDVFPSSFTIYRISFHSAFSRRALLRHDDRLSNLPRVIYFFTIIYGAHS